MPYGAATTGTRRVLHALGRVLVALDHLAQAVPLLLPGRHHHREQVRADAEELALVPDHHRAELALGAVDRVVDHLDHVGVDRVRLGLERQAEHAVAEVPRLGAGVLEHRPWSAPSSRAAGPPRAHGLERRLARVERALDVLAAGRVPHLGRPGRTPSAPARASSGRSTPAARRRPASSARRSRRSRARPRSRTGRAPSCSPTSSRYRSRPSHRRRRSPGSGAPRRRALRDSTVHANAPVAPGAATSCLTRCAGVLDPGQRLGRLGDVRVAAPWAGTRRSSDRASSSASPCFL